MARKSTRRPVCSHEGCGERCVIACILPLDAEPSDYLCPEHAAAAGFCPGCGYFIAGTMFGDRHGLCETCYEDNCEEPDYDDDEYDTCYFAGMECIP